MSEAETGYGHIEDYIKSIASAKTPEAVFDALLTAIAPYNFNSCLVCRMAISETVDATKNPYFSYSKLPEGWEETYLAKGYIHIDPFAQMALKTSRPFRWAESYLELTPAQKAMVKDSKDHGLKYGINFPMHYGEGVPGLVVYGSETDFDLSLDDKISLELYGRYAFETIEELLGSPADILKITLSEREREILTLVAQGKTNWEIGEILDVSEYSVRDWLKKLSKRLQTNNRTHTVMRAVQLGLILP